MPERTAPPQLDGTCPAIATVHVVDGRSAGDDGPHCVAAELRRRDREVLESRVQVRDGGPAVWLPELVDRLRSEVLAPADGPCPTVVHLFGWRAVVAASAAAGSPRPALVAHLGDGPPPAGPRDLGGQRIQRLVWAVARTMDAVVLDSEWALERALAAGVPRCRAVRSLPVAPVAECRRPWVAPKETGVRRLLAVGGVGRGAGTDVLVQAAGRLSGVQLVIAAPAGISGLALEPADRWLRAECRRGGFAGDTVRLEPFSLELLEDCDAVVDAGTTAGAADGVVAAMSRRRAVLATDLGPRAEAVVAGTTGELVPPGGDWRAWCGHIVRLLRDPFKLEAYADAGFERSRVGFAPSRRADVIDRLGERFGSPLAAAS